MPCAACTSVHPAGTSALSLTPRDAPATQHAPGCLLPLLRDAQAASTTIAESADAVAAAAPAEDAKAAAIYIGFAKGDYASREGRKGRVIRDDPTKYPAKEDLGPLLGATGALLLQLLFMHSILSHTQAAQCCLLHVLPLVAYVLLMC
eukprot:GHRQ01024011.1.p2 GENE.GHRQ01024011.1~~GHRQ01024011.1.p2  ORF type:complete len:148 (+),score=50.09 GHRQ01024011.1:387-830(+)